MRDFYEINLMQKINKPKELRKTLEPMGLSSKAESASNICLKDKNKIVSDNTKNFSIFKSLYINFAPNLVSKLTPSPNLFS